MKIYMHAKDYFKESKDIQHAIICAIESLYEKILSYEQRGIPFEKIFNDDRVKYDKQGKFYTFKYKKGSMQLRILYAYINVNDEHVMVIADYILKKKNNKDYIKRFEAIKNYNPYEMLDHSLAISY